MSNGRDGRSFGGFEKAPSFHQVRTHRRRFATMHDMMRRSRAREVALQLLFQRDLNPQRTTPTRTLRQGPAARAFTTEILHEPR